jgi:hypothetical protein
MIGCFRLCGVPRLIMPSLLAAAWLALTLAGTPLRAEDRSVTILEGVDEAPPQPASPPADTAPLASLRTENPAGVKIDVLPNATLKLGSRIAFSVSTQRPGYLVLVDINAEGRMTQIFPNVMTLSRTSSDVASNNLIKPGPAVTIPNPKNPLARFVFTADPPQGTGAIVAILSDRPVQIIDLPETPAERTSPQDLVDLIHQAVLGLKIASSDPSGPFTTSTWSMAAAPYAIQ